MKNNKGLTMISLVITVCYELDSQFRCNGSDGYLAFLDNLLEIRETANKTYDLDYDIQLNAALEVVQKKDFNKLVKEAKTLKERQQKAEEENKDLATTAQ